MGCVVNATPRQLCSQKQNPLMHCTGGWLGSRISVEGCEKIHPHRDLIPETYSP